MDGDLVTSGGVSLSPRSIDGRLPFARTIDLLRCHVAGVYYARVLEFAHELSRGDALTLRREPDNAYDVRAIVALDSTGRKLGYVPRALNEVLAALMDAGKSLTARIDAISLCDDGVEIDMVISLEED